MSALAEVLARPWPQADAAALRDELYRTAFARGLSPSAGTLTAAEFTAELSAANQSRSRWVEGWRIVRVEPTGSIVAVSGVYRRTASPGEYATTFTESLPPRPGMAATLFLQRESLTLQAGVYYAFGEAIARDGEDTQSLRFYFQACGEPAVAELFSRLTGELNARMIPFTLKTMLEPHERRRADATVLYVSRRREADARTVIGELPKSLLSRLGPTTPLFTLRLAAGIGMAESPSTGESFGMHRCRLVAEGILDARRAGREDVAARLQAVERRFREVGVDPAEPHLNGPWQIRNHDSRNRNFAVVGADGSGYFVKQLRVPGAASFRMMEREAAVYAMLADSGLTPAFQGFDRDAQTLRLALVRNAVDGAQAQRSGPRVDLAVAAARTLTSLHRLPTGRLAHADCFDRRPPGIYTAHRGGPLLPWLGPGQLSLIDMVREEPVLASALDRMASEWRCERLIHGDVKWENCLWTEDPPELKWIDWELSDLGDPCWDAGCFVQAHLSQRVLRGDHPLAPMGPALRAFFEEYTEAPALAILECAAARMIQMGLEVMHGRSEPTPEALRLVRSSAEILVRPAEALRLLRSE